MQKLIILSILFLNSQLTAKEYKIFIHGHKPTSFFESIGLALKNDDLIERRYPEKSRIEHQELLLDLSDPSVPENFKKKGWHHLVDKIMCWGNVGRPNISGLEKTEFAGICRKHKAISAVKFYNQLVEIKKTDPNAKFIILAHSNGGNLSLMLAEITNFLNGQTDIDPDVRYALLLSGDSNYQNQKSFFYRPQSKVFINYMMTFGMPVLPEGKKIVRKQATANTFGQIITLYSKADLIQTFDRGSSRSLSNRVIASRKTFPQLPDSKLLFCQAEVSLLHYGTKLRPGHVEIVFGPNNVEHNDKKQKWLFKEIYHPNNIYSYIDFHTLLQTKIKDMHEDLGKNSLNLETEISLDNGIKKLKLTEKPDYQNLSKPKKIIKKITEISAATWEQFRAVYFLLKVWYSRRQCNINNPNPA